MPAGSKPARQAARRGWLFDFERRGHPVLPQADFLRRVSVNVAIAAVLILSSLAVGMLGYHFLEPLGWLDSFLNASMILSGMGPLWSPKTDAGKLFAGVYALYSGIAVLAVAGVIFAPLIHRLLHRFHAEDSDQPDPPSRQPRDSR